MVMVKNFLTMTMAKMVKIWKQELQPQFLVLGGCYISITCPRNIITPNPRPQILFHRTSCQVHVRQARNYMNNTEYFVPRMTMRIDYGIKRIDHGIKNGNKNRIY